MMRPLLGPVLCLAVLASGCMTIGVAFTDPKTTSRAQVIAGGILGDAAIAGVANAVKGEYEMGEAEPTKNFFTYFLVLVAIDAVGAGVVWYLRRPDDQSQ